MKVETVQREEYFHGRVGDALVAIDEWVVEGKRVGQGRGFGSHGRMKIEPVECGARLCDGGFKRAQVTKSCRAAGALDDRSVQGHDLTKRQVPHQASRR